MKRMMPVFLSVALVALASVPAPQAFGSPAHPRPAEIAPSDWVPIRDDLAAVVGQLAGDPIAVPGSNSARGEPSTLGYFVAWRHGHWLRLDSLVQQPAFPRSAARPSKWLPIEKNLAFVIERQLPAQRIRGQLRTPSALGYFVIKRSGHWVRLQPIAEGALYRGPLTSRSAPAWVPISKGLRFVIEQQMPERYAPGQLPSVLGYFVGRRAGRWVRLGSIA